MPMRLDHRDIAEAERIRGVLHAGYSAEATLIGAEDFPPLARGAHDVANSAGPFAGLSLEGILAGVVELGVGDAVEIRSLSVDPRYARRGIGSKLVAWALDYAAGRTVSVSTAEANVAAVALYERFGFARWRRFTTLEGIACIVLRRPAGARPARPGAGRPC